MGQTDRQTDKATWWSITSFDEGEIKFLQGTVYPEFIMKIHGGLEKCPDTGRTHFQGAVQCRSQQRFSAIKKMLPKAHIEAAKSVEALRKYAMKADTAIGEKTVRSNSTPYWTMEMIMKLLAITPCPKTIIPVDDVFWHKVNLILLQKPYLVGLLAKPDIYRMFKHTCDTWIIHMTDPITNELLDEGAIVLQPPTDAPASVPGPGPTGEILEASWPPAGWDLGPRRGLRSQPADIIELESITDAHAPTPREETIEDDCEESYQGDCQEEEDTEEV